MKYIRQLCLILGFSFLGELCSMLLPFELPAAIYGLVLLVAALLLKIIKFEWIQETGAFLTGLLPLLFVVPVVGLLDHWQSMASDIGAIMVIVLVSTILTFSVSGLVTQKLMKKEETQDAAE